MRLESMFVVYFTFHRERETRCRSRRRPLSPLGAALRAFVARTESGRFRGELGLSSGARRFRRIDSTFHLSPHERERRLEKWSSKSRCWRGGNERLWMHTRFTWNHQVVDNFKFNVAETTRAQHYMRALNRRRLPIITLSRERGKLNTQFPAKLRNENQYTGRESYVIWPIWIFEQKLLVIHTRCIIIIWAFSYENYSIDKNLRTHELTLTIYKNNQARTRWYDQVY